MDPISSWQDYRSSASEIPSISRNKKIHYHIQKTPPFTVPWTTSIHSSPSNHISSRSLSILVLFPPCFPKTNSTHSSSIPCMPWDQRNSFPLIWTMEYYWQGVQLPKSSICSWYWSFSLSNSLCTQFAVVRITPTSYSESPMSRSWSWNIILERGFRKVPQPFQLSVSGHDHCPSRPFLFC